MPQRVFKFIQLYKREIIFLGIIYLIGVYFRLVPRLLIDSHQLTLNADIWERLSIAQYFQDHARLPQYCLRYIAYGQVPLWYPPISPILFALLSWLFRVDIPTVSSRIMPFIEAFTPLSIFFLGSFLFNKKVGYISLIFLSLTPSFIYWSGISDPQSFSLFMLPIYIILLVWRAKVDNLNQKKRWFWILGLGLLLGINFLTHLSYFLVVIILLFIALALAIERRPKINFFIDLLATILASQVLTLFWWGPKNLYWWWVKALVTSSGLYSTVQQLKEYGFLVAILEIAATLFLLCTIIFFPKKRKPFILLLFFWAFFPFLESQNETILNLIKHVELTWSTLFKPLEGFRFYCFLAQPLALMVGVALGEYILPLYRPVAKVLRNFVFLAIIAALVIDIHFSFDWYTKIKNSGITKDEYKAAVWFRNHSKESDRIIADYYRIQMFAGVCGGKSLLGGLFPLRNVNFPYIKVPARVQDDIYVIYNTEKPEAAYELSKRYHCTHIFFSENMIQYGALGSNYKSGFGVPINKEKFKDSRFFTEVYNHNNDVIILRVKE